MNTELANLLPSVIVIAHRAGEEILDVYQNGSTVTHKADSSPLTEADLRAHQVIVQALGLLTPEIPVLSEESAEIAYEMRSAWTRYWLVDPLDGTKEFIKRNGEFTVNIALIEQGRPVLGVVHTPVTGVCYYAAEGIGAFVQQGGEPAKKIRCVAPQAGQSIKVVASRSHADERTTALLARIANYECISMGSSLKLCLVAEGVAHFYPRLGPTMEWDTAAAHAVVNGAGGTVHDAQGAELHYNKANLLNPEFFVHARNDQYFEQLLKSPS